MCFDRDSLPPIPVLSGAAVSHDDLVLEASDGNRLAAFSAVPDEPSGAGIAILPDVRGLYRFYEELALRFAERGHAAIAIDYFGRTAGVDKRGDDFDYRPHVDADDVRWSAGGRRRRGCASPERWGDGDLHRRVLLRRPAFVARSGTAATDSPARSASTAGPVPAATARSGRPSAPRS